MGWAVTADALLFGEIPDANAAVVCAHCDQCAVGAKCQTADPSSFILENLARLECDRVVLLNRMSHVVFARPLTPRPGVEILAVRGIKHQQHVLPGIQRIRFPSGSRVPDLELMVVSDAHDLFAVG